MEIKVLSILVDLQIETGEKNLCASDNKKKAARALNISDFNTLNNYVKKFKDKGAIRKVGKNYVLNQLLNVKTTGVKVNIQREA